MTWHAINNLKPSVINEVSAEVEISLDSPWFSGHFPGEPILPGIAQLGIVQEAIEKSERKKLVVRSVSRVRFKQVIKSGDQLRLVATPVENKVATYSFRLMVDEKLVCSGIMKVDNQDVGDSGRDKTE
jgi:3-hydroxyacyl-[acyl-carrier-protein] dehydratase